MTKLSLKSKIILIIVAIIVFFGSLACYAVFVYSRQNFLDNEARAIKSLAVEQAEVNGVFFDQSKILLQTLASKDYLVEYLSQKDKIAQDEFILGKLNSYNLNNDYLAIYLMDAKGDALVSTDPSFVGQNYAFREYFQRAINGEAYLDVSLGVTSGQLGYYFSHSILDAEQQVIGVLVAKLNPRIIESVTKLNEKLNLSANIFLVDKFGVVIYSNKTDEILHSLGRLSSYERTNLISSQRFGDKEIESLSYDVVQGALPNLDQAAIFNFYDAEDGEEEILALAKISGYPFFILIEENLDNFIQQAYKISWTLAIFVALAAIFALLAISLFIRNFFKPLELLQGGLSNASRGNFEQKIVINSGDELEDVADSFNNLIVELKKSKEDIEKEVREKTNNLEKLNQSMVGRELEMIQLKKEIADLKMKLTDKK